jgi:hypothetical protein
VWSGSEERQERLVASFIDIFEIFIYMFLFLVPEIYTLQGQSLVKTFGKGPSLPMRQQPIRHPSLMNFAALRTVDAILFIGGAMIKASYS